jgi:hypothetical protein
MSACAASGKKETGMTTPQDTEQYIRRAAVDAEGNRIGKITKVYLDGQTGQPEWILVETGLFGTRQSFAPIRGSRLDGEQLVVLAVSKDQVKDAPNIDPDARISESEEDALRQYYSASPAPPGRPAVIRKAGKQDTRSVARKAQVESRHVIDGRAPAGRAAPAIDGRAPAGRAAPAEADLARRCREAEAPERWSRTDLC